MDNEFSRIERQLQEKGWEQVGEAPLVLGASLLPRLITEGVGKDGKTYCLKGAAIARPAEPKDGWYALRTAFWIQQSKSEAKGEPQGISYELQDLFEASCEAVAVAFGCVITVNANLSLVRFWEKKSKEGPSPDETLSEDQTSPPPSE